MCLCITYYIGGCRYNKPVGLLTKLRILHCDCFLKENFHASIIAVQSLITKNYMFIN